jgi:hypothetical protein
MTPLFKKLNFKNHRQITVLNSLESFLPELKAMEASTPVSPAVGKAKELDFVIVFATRQQQVDKAAEAVAPKLISDGIFWICYPKGSSKKYICDFNRDTGWNRLGELGFEPVRQVAVDEDWSALRFRRAEHIKTMTRSFAMTETGKEKVARAKKGK